VTLELPPDEMRRLGYRAVDRIVDHLEGIRTLPPIRLVEPGELAFLRAPCPEEPGEPLAELDAVFDDVLSAGAEMTHPRLFARVPGPSNYVSAVGQFAATGLNAFSASWLSGAGPTAIELTVLDWLRDWLGLPPGTEGTLTTGGSLGHLTALAAAASARGADRPRATGYVSDQTHATVERAWRVLGFDPAHLRVLPSDRRQRLPVEAVAAAISSDREAGLEPFCLVATSGTTSTGAVDPLPELADLAAAEGLWLHVDGAYGAVAALCEEGRRVLAGLERADSIALDPHKWLFQPYELGAVLVRRPGALEGAFGLDGDYLRDSAAGDVQLRNRGVELTRGARAVRLWLSLRVFGLRAFREAIAHGIALAEHAERFLRSRPGWEVLSPAQLAVVCFAPLEGDVDDLLARALADGYAAPSSTVVGGRVALRLCTINPRTTVEEIEETILRLERLAS
jgi:glutamate/tyrosine decarboxylase-like PLP-dependent enzyme